MLTVCAADHCALADGDAVCHQRPGDDCALLYHSAQLFEVPWQSLQMIGAPWVLSFSHLGVMKDLMDRLGADEADRKTLRQLIAARSEHELKELFRCRPWQTSVLEDLRALLRLSCGPAELPAALSDYDWISGEVLGELRELSRLFEGENSGAAFDFSVSGDLHYYNGLVFQGFVRGISEKILSGGRYDRLLERMERPGAAVGFAVYFSLLESLGKGGEEYDADVLLLYDGETSPTLLRDRVRELTENGKSVSAQRAPGGNCRTTEDLRGGGKRA